MDPQTALRTYAENLRRRMNGYPIIVQPEHLSLADNFNFVLSLEQKVIVQRAAGNQPAACQAEPADLQNHAECFEDEDSADNHQ